jgi:hypothetical protein
VTTLAVIACMIWNVFYCVLRTFEDFRRGRTTLGLIGIPATIGAMVIFVVLFMLGGAAL